MELNWLTYSIGVILFFGIISWFFNYLSEKDWEKYSWGDPVSGFSFLIGFVFLLGGNIHMANHKLTVDYQVTRNANLISLENSVGVTGSIQGSALEFSGNIRSLSTCNFIVEEEDGIRMVSVDASDVVFHEAQGDKYVAQKLNGIYMHPFHIKKTLSISNNDFTWHIWIPKNSINRYVKFN